MLTRRTPPSKKNDDDGDDQATDSLESGAGGVALFLPPPSHDNDNETATFKSFPHTRHSDNDKYIVISITSVNVKTSLKNILTYGSLLYIGYQLGHSSSRSSTQQQHLKSIRVPASTKWLFQKPPTLKQMYDKRNCESYLATFTRPENVLTRTILKSTRKRNGRNFVKYGEIRGQDPSNNTRRMIDDHRLLH